VDYSHRKDWLENRMIQLCSIFALDIYAYAVMSNHYHIVLNVEPLAPLEWTDEMVAEKWLIKRSSKPIENGLVLCLGLWGD
jgi:putative transposase